MTAFTKVLAGGVALAAVASAAPAAAQYYPGYGYGTPYGGNVVGQVLNQVLGGGYGYNGYGANSQVAVNQCASGGPGAPQRRLRRLWLQRLRIWRNARVLGISRVEQRSNGGLTVRGVASSGRYGRLWHAQAPVDLTWKCKVDYRGFVSEIDVDRAQSNYGYGNNYSPYGNYDYSQYGYRRY